MSSQFRSKHRCEASKDAGLAELPMIRRTDGRVVGKICPVSRYPPPSFLHGTLRPACLLTFSMRKGALQVGQALGMGRSHKANSQAGYLLQAKNERPLRVRFWTRPPPQPGWGHFTPSARGFVVLHSG